MKTDREKILDDAKKCVCEDREKQYGEPEDSFASIAAFWSDYLNVAITPSDACAMMALMKLARLKATNGMHRDSWVDLAGYAACGGGMIQFPFGDDALTF